MKKAGLMSTLGTVLGSVEVVAGEITRSIGILSSYNSNWAEARELDLARSRFERDVEWQRLGQAIQSTQFDAEAIAAAKERYTK